jgi:hypothetical protein
MQHPTILLQLAQDRRDGFAVDAARGRLEREVRAIEHREARDRFSVRELRWFMFRPVGA